MTGFLADAIIEVEAGITEIEGVKQLVKATNPSPLCITTVDEFDKNLRQGSLVLKIIYAAISCQAMYKIYHTIVNDTLCNSANSAIAWCWICFFFTAVFILLIDLFRFGWQLHEEELFEYVVEQRSERGRENENKGGKKRRKKKRSDEFYRCFAPRYSLL